jgi:hypothetical protein
MSGESGQHVGAQIVTLMLQIQKTEGHWAMLLWLTLHVDTHRTPTCRKLKPPNSPKLRFDA